MRPSDFTRAIGLAFCLGIPMLSLEAHAANPAEAFVAECLQKGSAILDDKSLDPAERDREFRDFVLSITDMKRVAMFTLGSYAKDGPEDAVTGFVAAFTDLDVALYRSGFSTYAHRLRITGSVIRANDDVIVNTESTNPDAGPEPMKIAFRVRKDDKGRNIILDVGLAGTWVAISQDQDFASYLLLNGGDIAQLSQALETRAAK
jgi:phospholipid transport system substrate-binding protein